MFNKNIGKLGRESGRWTWPNTSRNSLEKLACSWTVEILVLASESWLRGCGWAKDAEGGGTW